MSCSNVIFYWNTTWQKKLNYSIQNTILTICLFKIVFCHRKPLIYYTTLNFELRKKIPRLAYIYRWIDQFYLTWSIYWIPTMSRTYTRFDSRWTYVFAVATNKEQLQKYRVIMNEIISFSLYMCVYYIYSCFFKRYKYSNTNQWIQTNLSLICNKLIKNMTS